MSELIYSGEQELRKIALQNGLVLPKEQKVVEPSFPIIQDDIQAQAQLEFEDEGAVVAEKIRQFGNLGWRPSFEEAKKYREFMKKQEVSAWASIGAAIEQTASDLTSAAYELAGDALTLKVPKVAGSVIEGAALGTKNWFYMYEEAKYNEDSILHKMLYDKNGSEEEYYYNLTKLLDVRQSMDKDIKEGILLPREYEVGGVKFDLWNPAVVMGISYVADPSWVMPNLGIEATLAKGARNASKIIALNEQLANVSTWSAKQAELAAAKTGQFSKTLANQIVKTEEDLLRNIKEAVGLDAFMGTSGNVVAKDDIARGAMAAGGLNSVKIPAWGVTTLTWGTAKIAETTASAVELAAKIAQEPTMYDGLRLSERLAMRSDNKVVRSLANTWAKTGSPLVEWAGNTTKTSLHSAMYGGAFGFVFGGEEGFYNGIGSGFVIGGAFHQIGAIHGTVAGADAPREVVKNFLWATDSFDYLNKEGVYRLLENVAKEGGEEAKLQVMADIAASERLQRDVKRVILTEERIKEFLGGDESPAWSDYERKTLQDPDFGGIAFARKSDGQKVVIINADRAHQFAVREELFHTLMMDGRYGLEFQKHALDALVGTEDAKGALYQMPKADSVRLLEQFRDVYLGLEDKATDGDSARITEMKKEWDDVIDKFKQGQTDGRLHKLFEEFLASYWNDYVADKPLDYLLKGGDLGLVRNVIETAKDAYKNTMQQDLMSAGGRFTFGEKIDGFFVNQTTGKRVVIPKLEKMMKHFVERSSKEMFRGWTKNQRSLGTVEKAMASGFGHLVVKNADGSTRLMTAAERNKAHSKSVKTAIEKIAELAPEDRSLKFTVVGGDKDGTNFSFSPKKKKPKKKKAVKETKPLEGEESPVTYTVKKRIDDFWSEERDRLKGKDEGLEGAVEGDLADEIDTAKDAAGEVIESSGWSTDKRGKFWKSVWEGNPRIKITGLASKKELAILEEHLPYAIVSRFKTLNTIIEMSRRGTFAGGVSNIVSADVLTKQKGPYNKTLLRDTEGGPFEDRRNFQPVEINIYWEREQNIERDADGDITSEEVSVGGLAMLVKVIDHDAILERVGHFFDKNRLDIDYKEVRRLFGTKDNLYRAAKDLLSRYSNSKIAEGGIELFKAGGAVGSRDAARMRTIVNGVLGFHPTKEMVRKGEYYNPWHELQVRKSSEKADLPHVIKDFRVDNIGNIATKDGEGFFYDHDNAHPRSQYNFSPSKSWRDHEGNPMSKAELASVKNSVYRNREGEIISVYSLRKYNAERKLKEGSMFMHIDDSFGAIVDLLEPRARSKDYYSDSGWLHYTPNMSEASLSSQGKMSTGYIDTQRHLDISHIDYNSNPEVYIKAIVDGLSSITGRSALEHTNELMKLRDLNGRRLSELFNDTTNPFEMATDNVETWLFTKDMARYFKENGIHSVEYLHYNPITETTSGAVALWDNSRFIENRSRAAEANYFAYSPAKKREVTPDGRLAPKSMLDILNKQIQETVRANIAKGLSPDEAAWEAFMLYKVSEDGQTIEVNSQRITADTINRIISDEVARYEKLLGNELKTKDFFDKEGREKISAVIKPKMMKALRSQMPTVPTRTLSQIADFALQGFSEGMISAEKVKAKPVGAKGRGRTQDLLVVKDTVIGRLRKTSLLTAEKIEKSGIPRLFEIAEMTEGEWQIAKKLPEFITQIKNGTSEQWIANNLYTVHKLMGEHGGLAGFRQMHKGRQKDIFFLMDKMLQTEMETTDGTIFTVMKHENLRNLYAERTKQFVYEMLKDNQMGLLERQGYLKTWQKYRNMTKESRDLRSQFKAYNDSIHAMLKEEFSTRVLDTLTALELGEIDLDTAEAVRAQLYDDAKRGLYPLGSYDAIARSVQIYYDITNQEAKKQVINTKLALKKNLIKSFNELEKSGFVGIQFTQEKNTFNLENGKKKKQPITVHFIDSVRGKWKDDEALNVWNFDGTHFKIIEQFYKTETTKDEKGYPQAVNKNVLKLVDMRTGREVLTGIVNEEGVSQRNAELNTFLSEAQARIHQEVPESVLTANFGRVEGPMKSYLLLNNEVHNRLSGDPAKFHDQIFDFSEYDVYKNGQYFVIINRGTKGEAEFIHQKEMSRIAELKEAIENEVVKSYVTKGGKKYAKVRKATVDDLLDMRMQLTKLQGKIHKDHGVVVEVDEIGRVHVVAENHSKTDQQVALAKLKAGKMENIALQQYINLMYKDFVKLKEAKKKGEVERINKVTSKGPEGNLAKINELAKRVYEAQTEFQKGMSSKMKEMNAELKKAGIDREVTGMEVYKQIERDYDAARKNAANAFKRVIAIERQLWLEGAFPEYDRMSRSQQIAFRERMEGSLQSEWVQNPLDGKWQEVNFSWTDKNLARLENENPIAYIGRLRTELARQKSLHGEYTFKEQSVGELINKKKGIIAEIENEFVFLVQQYSLAKGLNVSRKQALSLIERLDINDVTSSRAVIQIGKIDKLSGKKVEPRYLPDKEGVVTDKKGRKGVGERYESVEDLNKVFATALADVSSTWQGMTGRRMMELNSIIERRSRLEKRNEFPEPEPKKEDFESPRQYREAVDTWKRMKEAYEANWSSLLGAFREGWNQEVASMVKSKKKDKSIKDKDILGRLDRMMNRDANIRIKELLSEYLDERSVLIREVLGNARKQRNNTEFNFHADFERIVSEGQSMTLRQEAWVRDPANRELVESLQAQYIRGDISEAQLVDRIKDEAFLSTYGEDGFALSESDSQLTLVRNKITEKLNQIDNISFGEERAKYDSNFIFDKDRAEKSIARIRDELIELRKEEDALVQRIDSIIQDANTVVNSSHFERLDKERMKAEDRVRQLEMFVSEYEDGLNAESSSQYRREYVKLKSDLAQVKGRLSDINNSINKIPAEQRTYNLRDNNRVSIFASQEFAGLVERILAKRKIDEDIEVERIRRHKNRVELARRWTENYRDLIEDFRQDAITLGFRDPAIVVSPDNPRTRLLYLAFPQITFDLYGTAHPLDWSGSGGAYEIGYTEKGERILKFGGAQDPANIVAHEESQNKIPIHTVADYMFFARKKAEWHEANPNASMSAEDFILITSLVPRSRYFPSQEKLDSINRKDLQAKRRVMNGILDNISIPENKERLIKTFVKDGISLVIDSMALKVDAYKRINSLSDAQWAELIKGKSPEEVNALLMDKETIENAFYWISDGFIPLREASEDVEMLTTKGSLTPIRTRQMSVQALIELDGFLTHMDTELSSRKLSSMFDSMPYAKVLYESLPVNERLMLDADAKAKLALENDASVLRHQAEVVQRRGNKPLWFADKITDTKFTGRTVDSQAIEMERVTRILSEAAATEASIQKYKGEVGVFTKTRTRAVDHMLSLDDGLAFKDLNWDVDAPWTKETSIRESNDGRYIIQRKVGEKKGEYFEVYFIGETVKNPDGTLLYEVPTTRIGTFNNTREAQVLVRFFEDDVHRIREAATVVRGGQDEFSPLRVAGQILQREGKGALLTTAYKAQPFSEAVVEAMQKAGKDPQTTQLVKRLLRPIGDFGEIQRLEFTSATGVVKRKQLVITPSKEGVLNKYFDRAVHEDGTTIWIQKPKQKVVEASKETNQSTEVDRTQDASVDKSTKPDSLREPTKEEQTVSDASEFTVVQNVTKNGQVFNEWEVIRNKLGYQLIRSIDESGKRNVFKLFNSASNYLGQYYHEMDAVDRILEEELGNE
jgi:hypothetical protein